MPQIREFGGQRYSRVEIARRVGEDIGDDAPARRDAASLRDADRHAVRKQGGLQARDHPVAEGEAEVQQPLVEVFVIAVEIGRGQQPPVLVVGAAELGLRL